MITNAQVYRPTGDFNSVCYKQENTALMSDLEIWSNVIAYKQQDWHLLDENVQAYANDLFSGN